MADDRIDHTDDLQVVSCEPEREPAVADERDRAASSWDDDALFRNPDADRPATPGGASVFRPERAVGAVDAPHTPAEPGPESEAEAAVRREQERLAAERQARREARLAALNPAPVHPAEATLAAAPVAAAAAPRVEAQAPARHVRYTDRFLPSLGLLLLRLAVAAIVGLHGLDKLLNPARATEVYANTVLPQPQLVAIGVGVLEVGIAIALVFGLLTRVAGVALAGVAIATLAFVLWGPWSPFPAGKAGFVGELELLLAAVGVLFAVVGAGGWAIDRGFRARRAADAAARDADF